MGDVAPVSSLADVRTVIGEIRATLPGASHYCYAYSIYEPPLIKSSDDGEPGGSAGRPILAQIQGRGLLDILVVVTRFFGGTKLGVGGLARAYGAAARAALDRVEHVNVIPTRSLAFEHEYRVTADVQAALHALGLAPVDARYGERVRLCLEVPDADVADVRSALSRLRGVKIE